MDTYTGDPDNYVEDVRFAEDGDAPSETVMIAPTLEDLADSIAYINKRTVAKGINGDLKTRGVPWCPNFNTSYWELDSDGKLVTLAGNNGGGVFNAWLPLDLPPHCTLESFSLLVDAAAGHSSPPGQQVGGDNFRMILQRQTLSTGVWADVQSFEDPSGTNGTYENEHLVNYTAISHAVDRETYAYRLVLVNELGTGAIDAGLKVHCCVIGYTGGSY